MLDALRKQTTGWVAQILIGLLVLSFAVWGVSGFFTGFYADTVATVGKTDVSTNAFARQYDQAVQAITRQTGRPVTAAQAQLFGLPNEVLGGLVTQATLDDTARQYGLGISDTVLAQRIAEDPAFRGPGGNFERTFFQQVLRNNGYTEDQYVRDQQAVYLRFQLSNALVNGANTPESYLRALHEYRSEERNIEYVVLTASAAGSIPEPTATELNAYFDETGSEWRAPEYRGIGLFEVTPSDIAKPDEITEDEVRTAYDRNVDDYTQFERRRVSQIIFETSEEATTASAEIAGGKSFDMVAGEKGLTAADTNLGLMTRREIIDPKVAEAAFALDAGTTSDAVEGGFGWVILRVDEVQPEEIRTFSEVEDDLRQELAVQLARRRIIESFDEVEDSRAAGETLAEIATKIGVPFVTIDAVDRTGNDPNEQEVADLPAKSELLTEAFNSDVEIENDAIRTSDGGYVWYEVTSITQETDRVLDDVREKVIVAWKQSQIDERLAATAEDIRSRIEGGETVDEVGEEMTLPVKTAFNLTRTSQPPADLSAPAIAATFGGPKDHVAITSGSGDGGAVAVLVVTEVFVPPFNEGAPELVQVRQQLSNQIGNDYLQQFVVEKQSQLGVSINQTSLHAVVGQMSAGGF